MLTFTGVAVTDLDGAGCARTIGDLAAGATETYDCTGTVTPAKDAVARVHVVGTEPSEDPVGADGAAALQLTY